MRCSRQHPWRIRALLVPALVVILVEPARGSAQGNDNAPGKGQPTFWLVGGALITAAAAFDETLERASLAHRSSTLDDLASVGNALGLGRHILPTLGASYLAARLARRPRFAEGVLHVTAAYALGNVAASIGKPVFGRHRPDTLGSPWRIRPFTIEGAWHSLPSAHTLHAFTLAGAISEEAHEPWVTASAYGAAIVVGWSRVYGDEHWASDVVASAVLGAAIGHVTVRRLHARRQHRHSYSIALQPRSAAVLLSW